MSLGVHTLLVILCNVWCLIRGTSVMIPGIAVRCAEEAVLPCTVLQDSSISYQTASWYKMAGDSEAITWEVLDVESHYPREAGGSLKLSNDTSFSLRIKNATSWNSGTYKCTLRGQSGERNLSSTVTLKVSGCPGIEEDKLKKYKGELFMLTCLGIFYLLLIFFTCTCLRRESMSPNYQKTRPDMKHMLTLINPVFPEKPETFHSKAPGAVPPHLHDANDIIPKQLDIWKTESSCRSLDQNEEDEFS